MNVTALMVAKYVIKSFHDREDLITNLKLQKLLYYVQGWHLGLYKNPLFDGNFQAWVHGPVLPEIYNRYKCYTWNPIDEAISLNDLKAIDKEKQKLIDDVLEVYAIESAWSLEKMTHAESPWINARRNLPVDEESTAIISNESMMQFFSTLANKNVEEN